MSQLSEAFAGWRQDDSLAGESDFGTSSGVKAAQGLALDLPSVRLRIQVFGAVPEDIIEAGRGHEGIEVPDRCGKNAGPGIFERGTETAFKLPEQRLRPALHQAFGQAFLFPLLYGCRHNYLPRVGLEEEPLKILPGQVVGSHNITG